MWFSDFLLGKKKNNARQQILSKPVGLQQPQNAPGPVVRETQIAYNPDLVPQLKAEHQHLLELFGMVMTAFSQNDLPSTVKLLGDFRRKLHGHRLTENIRFYIYLEHSLAEDREKLFIAYSFRQEMEEIGKVMHAFVHKYKEIATHPDAFTSFGQELDNIGKVLVNRIQREEKILYPLYFQTY